ncbi:MAG: hypothetical protein JW748_13245 [Anaerolineales bacterium]|nr:hypothetical protein [Anaerolineales bacterium]
MPSDSPFLTCFELGVEKSEHPIKAWNRWGNLILGVLLTGAGIAALLVAVMSASMTAGFLFLACLGFGGWCLWSAWHDWSRAVAVFDRGIAVARGEDVRQVPWEEVAAVWQSITKHYTHGVYTGTTYLYSVQLADDTIYKFDGKHKDIEGLGKAIQTNVTNTLYPKYIAALKVGSRLEFGPLALDYNKLYSGKKELNWDDVKSVKIQGGYVSVKKDKGWFRWTNVGVPQIPNFFILYALLKEFGLVE